MLRPLCAGGHRLPPPLLPQPGPGRQPDQEQGPPPVRRPGPRAAQRVDGEDGPRGHHQPPAEASAGAGPAADGRGHQEEGSGERPLPPGLRAPAAASSAPGEHSRVVNQKTASRPLGIISPRGSGKCFPRRRSSWILWSVDEDG